MKRVTRGVAVAIIPVALIGLATFRLYEARFNVESLFHDNAGALTVLALAGGLYALSLLIYISLLKERLARSVGDREKILKIGDFYAEKTESMQSDMEVLSAVRNLTSILADESELDSILTQVTQVVQEITECREVTVFLLDEGTKKPIARAHRVGNSCVAGDELIKAGLEDDSILDAIRYRTVMRSLDSDNQATFAVPLSADQELLGALRLVSDLSGGASEKSERMERTESMTLSLAKHISIAIKTPILYNRAVVDSLTGLYTRRHFARQMESQFSASLRLKHPMSLIMLDIDFFKRLNDSHGHLFGDQVLIDVGKLILGTLRGYDTAYRYGGEEICVILPEADADAARKVAERIRNKLSRRVFRTGNRTRVQVTLSAGVAQFEQGMKEFSNLIQRADEALYTAKETGRNRTCVWDPDLHENLPAETSRAVKPKSKPTLPMPE